MILPSKGSMEEISRLCILFKTDFLTNWFGFYLHSYLPEKFYFNELKWNDVFMSFEFFKGWAFQHDQITQPAFFFQSLFLS